MTRLDLIIWLSIALNSCFHHRSVSSTKIVVYFAVETVQELNRQIENLIPEPSAESQMINARFAIHSILNGSIDLAQLTADANFTLQLTLKNVKGFNIIHSAPLLLVNPSNLWIFVDINSGSFSFFDDKSDQVGPNCNDYLKAYFRLSDLEYEKANKTDLLHRLSGVFQFQLRKLTLNPEVGIEPICPLVFKNSVIIILQIYKLEKTSLVDRVLQFSALDQVQGSLKLNCAVRLLELLHVYRVCIGKKLLNKNVFKYTQFVTVRGVVQSIEPDVFKTFTHLRLVKLKLYSLRTFYHSSDNSWLTSINYGNNYDPSLWKEGSRKSVEEMLRYSVDLLLEDLSQEYDYPDEDFCLFKYMPHRQLVLPLIERTGSGSFNTSSDVSKLSCTLLYLAQYVYVLANSGDLNEGLTAITPGEYYMIDDQVESNALANCNFSQRLEVCLNTTVNAAGKVVKTRKEPNLYDIIYVLEWAELLGPIITFPFISLLGFICNLLIAIVISNKHNKKEIFKGERIFQYMFVNSIFNMIECLISIFTLMSECIGPQSVYCSSVMKYLVVQYFKIYFIQYFGEVMKTCSILSVLAISFERYCKTVDKPALRRIGDMSITRFLVLVISFSLVTCLCKFFEYTTEPKTNASIEYPSLDIIFQRSSFAFSAAYIVHYVLNDLIILCLNFFIDLLLLLTIRKDLTIKRHNLVGMTAAVASIDTRLDLINKTEKKTNRMPIYTLIVYVFCRFPELIVYLHLMFIRNLSADQLDYDYYSMCLISICILLANIIQYLYMLSYIANLFFYFKFNRSFRRGFKVCFGRYRMEFQKDF